MLYNEPDILTIRQLKEAKAQVKVLLFAKGNVRLFVNHIGVFIIEKPGMEAFWTFNESQAVEKWNEI